MKINQKYTLGLLSIGFSLSAMLVSCAPPKDASLGVGKEPPQTKLSTLSAAEADCETKLRKRMLDKNFAFSASDHFSEEISNANIQMKRLKKRTYSAQQMKSEIISVGVEYSENSDSLKSIMRYSLSRANSGLSSDAFSLSVSLESVDAKQDLTFSQNFQISQACEVRLSQSSIEKLTKQDAENYSYSKDSSFSDGDLQNQKDKFHLAKNDFLANLSGDLNSISGFPASGFAYMQTIGLVHFEMQDLGIKKRKEMGLDLTLKTKVLSSTLKDKAFLKITEGIDENIGVKLTEVSNQKQWQLPVAIWESQKLGSSTDLNSTIEFKLSKNYLETNNSFQMSAERVPNYDHFAAYFKISKPTEDTNSHSINMTLSENAAAITNDGTSEIDMASNDTVQTKLPQIQKIASEILAVEAKDRKGQVQQILNYLSQNYIYDEDMARNNNIRPLTTEEALKRGKGVCQHYAVIFTSIARALKIPTRIVMGFSLAGAAPVGHAWNEVELQPGVWRVIEPQDVKTLTQMQTRYYLPMARGLPLEDKSKSWGDFVMEMLSANYSIRPL